MQALVKRIRAQYHTMQMIHTLMSQLWAGEIQGFGVRRDAEGFVVTVEPRSGRQRRAA